MKHKAAEITSESLPQRTINTMSEAIALSSPSGKMSRRAKEAASKRLADALFGDRSCFQKQTAQPSEKERLLRQAKELRELAARGMKTRAYTRKAEELERRAEQL